MFNWKFLFYFICINFTCKYDNVDNQALHVLNEIDI